MLRITSPKLPFDESFRYDLYCAEQNTCWAVNWG
jgi:hypothetical protein